MDKIILIPCVISFYLLLKKDPKDVFIFVFLPSLTLFPTYFETKLVSGIPEVAFWSAALIPIIAVWSADKFKGYHYNSMDMVLFLYILVVFIGQWTNSSYKPAQKILFNNSMAIFMPFVLVRSLCRDRDTIISFLKMITLLGAFVAIFNIIEFRMFTNYFDKILRNMWPRSVMWDTGMIMSRWGFKRALGPFAHPIVAGYFYSLTTPLAAWCYIQGIYRNKKLGLFIVALNVLGIFVSLSRAPIACFFISLIIVFYGWSKNKTAIFTTLSIVLLIILIIFIPTFIEYASTTRASAETVDQRNIAYRKEMWQAYAEVVMEKPFLGWGRFSIPSVNGLSSIDSEYLGISLSSGLIALFFYLTFLSVTLARLLINAMTSSYDNPRGQLLWCLTAAWCSALFTQFTVYSGAQTIQYLYMLGGIGLVLAELPDIFSIDDNSEKIDSRMTNFGFRRVI